MIPLTPSKPSASASISPRSTILKGLMAWAPLWESTLQHSNLGDLSLLREWWLHLLGRAVAAPGPLGAGPDAWRHIGEFPNLGRDKGRDDAQAGIGP
jgi:hypothetical protein